MIPDRPVVIAIDGPAASGKSTTGLAVAQELGALHVDSGALYRALTAVFLGEFADLGCHPPDEAQVLRAALRRGLALQQSGGSLVPFLDGSDAEPLLRSPAVNGAVSMVSGWPAIREWVNARLRDAATTHPGLLVLDGRDIGTVVFPDAPVKVFLTATPEVRARRRLLQWGGSLDPSEVAREAAELAERDRRDSERPIAPLRSAADAVILDTSDLTFPEQVGRIVSLVRRRLPEG
ncbi:MAG: (d)CMP kinase [Gemmatimonadales bacterium]